MLLTDWLEARGLVERRRRPGRRPRLGPAPHARRASSSADGLQRRRAARTTEAHRRVPRPTSDRRELLQAAREARGSQEPYHPTEEVACRHVADSSAPPRSACSAARFPFTARAQGVDTAKIIVGFPPGGTTDVMARKVADKLRGAYARGVRSSRTGRAPAASSASSALKDSPADGSAMLLTPSSMLTIYPYTYKTLQYKLDDVAPVSLAMYTHHVLSVGPAVPDSVKTLKDFFAWAKANPDKAAYGSPGAGSMPHLIGVLLNKASGADLRHVGYRGSAPGIQDLLGGQIAVVPRPGRRRAHAFQGRQGARARHLRRSERDVFLPDVPTMREQGFKIALREWYAFFMPAKASAETVQRASAALRQAIAQPDVVEFGKQFGLEVQASGAARARRRCSRRTQPSGAASSRRPASRPTRERGEHAAGRERPARPPGGGRRAPRGGNVYLRSPRSAAGVSAQADRAARPLGRARAGARVPRAARRRRRVAAPHLRAGARAGRGASRRRCSSARLSAERPLAVLSGNDIEHALIAARRAVRRRALRAGVAGVLAAVEGFRQAEHVMRAAHAGAGLRFGPSRRSRRRSTLRCPASRFVSTTTSTSSKGRADASRRRGARPRRAGHDRQVPLHLRLDRRAEGGDQHAAHVVLEPGDDPLDVRLLRRTSRRSSSTGRRGTTPRRATTTSAWCSTTAAPTTSTRASRCPARSRPRCATCGRSRRPGTSTCRRATRRCCLT